MPRAKKKLTTAEALELLRRRAKSHDQYPFNPCFMRKTDVRIGTLIQSLGRMSQGIVFRVYKITTRLAHIEHKPVEVDHVFTLKDDVYLRDDNTNEVRIITFSRLSYSAIWWLFEKGKIAE